MVTDARHRAAVRDTVVALVRQAMTLASADAATV